MTELADIIKRESIAWRRLTLQDAFDLHLKLSSRVRELEEDLKLSAKSYEANSKGWQADIAAAKERIKVLEDALKDIARQNLESEIHEDYREDADYRGAYDCIIRVARAAL